LIRCDSSCFLQVARRAISLVALVILTGCREQPALTSLDRPAAVTKSEEAADLRLALESLRKLAEGADNQAALRTIFYLNQWLSSDPAGSAAWKADRMLDSLPRTFRNTPGLERLEKLQFSATAYAQWLDDISFLQQNLWLHDIAQRARQEPPPPSLRPWLKEMEQSLGVSEAEQLAIAERMLDWITRNIQLDPLPATPRDPLATAGSSNEAQVAAARGQLGPGYGRLPLETLLYGHGDAHERARIFILLCRQAGIEAVMLGLAEEQSATRRGWTPAVLVGGNLYLFEPSLGLPIPGPEGKGIATLDQVLKDPQLLRRLDVEGLPAYPVTEKDLKPGVTAMIDAEPAALARRMQMLQAAMPANRRLALTTQPNTLDAPLRKAKASLVILWHVPFEAVLYRIGQQQLAMRDQQAAKDQHRQGVLFSPARPLIKGRNLHLQGRYENEDQKKGARSLYLECRPPDREIEALINNEFYRKTIGLEQTLPEEPNQKQAVLDLYTGIAREGKFHATYWLALTYSDAGKPKSAIEWLGKPIVEASPPSPWLPGARYNLARCYEQIGELDLARQWLESDKDSPQRHGNLLRAKMLKQQAQ
jgi:tetratricopeptide (TPR) repeat protein